MAARPGDESYIPDSPDLLNLLANSVLSVGLRHSDATASCVSSGSVFPSAAYGGSLSPTRRAGSEPHTSPELRQHTFFSAYNWGTAAYDELAREAAALNRQADQLKAAIARRGVEVPPLSSCPQ